MRILLRTCPARFDDPKKIVQRFFEKPDLTLDGKVEKNSKKAGQRANSFRST